MSTGLQFGRDAHNECAYDPIPSTTIYTATITNGTARAQTLPVSPTGWWHVSYRYYPAGTSVFVDVTGANAAVPAGATFAASTSEGNPAGHFLPSGANVSMITGATTCDVSIVLWQGQPTQ